MPLRRAESANSKTRRLRVPATTSSRRNAPDSNADSAARTPGEIIRPCCAAFLIVGAIMAQLADRALQEFARHPAGLKELDFADRMREAADLGLIRDPRDFLEYRKKRNTTSHAYNESLAEDVLSVVDDFLADAKFLLRQLQKRNK